MLHEPWRARDTLQSIQGASVARDTANKKPKKKKKKDRKGPAATAGPKALSGKRGATTAGKGKPRVAGAIKSAKSAASKLKDNPVISEIVAAALVATAAALKDPQKARRLAEDAGDELQRAGKKATRKSQDFWNLALDIARRTVDSIGGNDEPPPRRAAKPKK